MTPATRLTAAGFVGTAIAFGPARMGFGLFLPAFRDEFALSTSTAGLIASGGFLAFLLALLASAWMGRRHGERVPVVMGAIAAAAGFVAVASADEPAWLALGIGLSGASAGMCWAPFNDAAERMLPDSARAGALSIISTGTTFGVIIAAGLAHLVTQGVLDWRAVWMGFTFGALLLAGMAMAGLPSSGRGAKPAQVAMEQIILTALPAVEATPAVAARLTQRAALPLYATAFCYGVANAVFLSFAADRVVTAGGLPGLPDEAASTLIFLAYGVCGVLGLATGRIEARTGLAPLLCAIFAASALSLILIALFPVSWVAVLAASGLHGASVMMVSALFSFWSLRLFPGRGTLGFTATLLSIAAGSVIGPAVAGVLAASYGPVVMFLAAAAPPLVPALWFGAKLAQPRSPSPGDAR